LPLKVWEKSDHRQKEHGQPATEQQFMTIEGRGEWCWEGFGLYLMSSATM